jgi:hypothetical protein
VLITIAVLLFLVISGLLARFLSTENSERDGILSLLNAQVKGDERGLVDQISGCAQSATCRATEQANARRLRRNGSVKILTLKSSTAYALTSKTGKTRVAWTVIGGLPVVQCVLVRRRGNALKGMSLSMLALSAPIANTADC